MEFYGNTLVKKIQNLKKNLTDFKYFGNPADIETKRQVSRSSKVITVLSTTDRSVLDLCIVRCSHASLIH